jgi:hydrogenase maturation protease
MALTDNEALPPRDTLVIGIGNPLCGDDGAGPAVVAALPVSPHARYLDVHQLLPELADDIARARRVIFVDASVTATAVTVRRVAPTEGRGLRSHVLSPQALLRLCQEAYGTLPRSAWVVEIPASGFDLGAGLSPHTRQGVDAAVEAVARLIGPGARAHGRLDGATVE